MRPADAHTRKIRTDAIRVTTLERDVSTYNTDACGVRLDSHNDEENALLYAHTLRLGAVGATPAPPDS